MDVRGKNYLDPLKRRYYEDKLDDLKLLLEGEDSKIPEHLSKQMYSDVKKRPMSDRDKMEIKRQIANIENILKNQTAPCVNDVDKNKIHRRYIELREEIKSSILTKDEMWYPTSANIFKLTRWNEEFVNTGKIEEFRNCCRILDKSDELLGQLEQYRKPH